MERKSRASDGTPRGLAVSQDASARMASMERLGTELDFGKNKTKQIKMRRPEASSLLPHPPPSPPLNSWGWKEKRNVNNMENNLLIT